ncbi:MAG: response regulator [Lachnospiraceae bacterium]|nr:response regulator [Lachnospiraceae bacterium]
MFKNSLSTKILIMVEVILLISSSLFCTVSISRARSSIRKSIQQRMLDIANCAAASVNGDVLKLLSEDNVGGEESKEVYKTLAVFRDNVELTYVYCIKQQSEMHYIFTLDLDPLTPAQYGEEVEYTLALDSAGHGTAAVDEVPYTDKWGEFYSAYSPVFDSDGNVAGVVAVDFAVDWFEDQLSAQTRSTISSYLIILIFSLLVGGILAWLTVRPYVRQQGELLEEKVRAESANHAKSDFLANMSHEIRTPINAVLGMNEMILREDRRALKAEKEIDSEIAKDALKNIGVYAADVENAGHNLLALVNDILDFSKIEAGRLDLVEAPYKLTSILNNLSNMVLFKAQDKGLNFIIDVDETLPNELLGDEMRVKQVLTNILNNAVKYTEKGHVKLTLKGEKQSEDKILLTVEVEDTGIGIKEEDRAKLFTQFQRLEMERNSTVEGTGLGLVITQRLLEMMGGSISVVSEYGKGSTFTVCIPQKVVSENAVGDFQARFKANVIEAKTYRESFRAPSAHILIVDDTRINLTVAVNLLKNTGMQIDTATGGAKAVNMAEKTAYDIILMDQRMPEMDGTEALHRIRATEGGMSSLAPVICLTADAVVGAKERYLSEGFSDYLTKPIDSYELEKMLMKHLPKEKVELVRDENDKASQEPVKEGDLSALTNAGIDTKTGLKYCQNEESFYRTVLAEFAEVSKEKGADLQKAFDAKDWKNYEVHVHSLKSTSKMIGAKDLSTLAASLEVAAVSEDAGAIEANHDGMMKKYKNVTEAIYSVIPADQFMSDEADAAKKALEEEGIMEFLPEEN